VPPTDVDRLTTGATASTYAERAPVETETCRMATEYCKVPITIVVRYLYFVERTTMGIVTHRYEDQASDVDGPGVHSPDDLFHILQNHRRRFAIHYLKQTQESVDVGDLATQIAAWENGIAPDAVTSKQRRRVYNALQQTHLAKLADSGLVEVNRRDVDLTERGEQVEVYMEIVHAKDIPWSEYYLVLGIVGLAVVVATSLNIGPFAMVPDIGVEVFLSVTVIVSALGNLYTQHASQLGNSTKPPELRGE